MSQIPFTIQEFVISQIAVEILLGLQFTESDRFYQRIKIKTHCTQLNTENNFYFRLCWYFDSE